MISLFKFLFSEPNTFNLCLLFNFIGMSGCLDNCSCTIEAEWFESVRSKRNSIAAALSGFIFFGGWWFGIDAASIYPSNDDFPQGLHVLAVFSTISFFMINSVSNSLVRGDDSYNSGCLSTNGARVWIFFGYLFGFATIIASCWLMLSEFILHNKRPYVYPGVAIFLQNIFIFIASLIFKFGRKESLY